MLEIRIVKLRKSGVIPTKGHESSDAGWDLYAAEDISLPPQTQKLIPLGISIAIPEGWVGLIQDRSGMAYKRRMVANAGVIDARYRGEVNVLLANENPVNPYLSPESHVIKAGERVAQMLILPVPTVEFVEVEELDSTKRQSGGFGSSGK